MKPILFVIAVTIALVIGVCVIYRFGVSDEEFREALTIRGELRK